MPEANKQIYLRQKLGDDYRPVKRSIKDSILYQDLQLYAESQGEELVRFTKVSNK